MIPKTKIVLDADVLIHFIKGERLFLLFDIFPEYAYLILDVVYREVSVYKDCRTQIDNALKMFYMRFENIKFEPKGVSRLEYARLISTLGRGESACMVYCRDNKDVLGSSNLKDIRQYCEENGITYLTTLDFLYYAFIRGKLSEKECTTFIDTVIAKGSKLPKVDISHYLPSCQM